MYITYVLSVSFLILLLNFQTFSLNSIEVTTIDISSNNVALNISILNDSSNITNRRQFFQPERSEFYDPNWGYEPYWVHGDYYFNITNTTVVDPRLNITTICGGPCPFMFTLYGVICARNNNMTHRTFKNYCELVDIDCNNRMNLSWRAVLVVCQTVDEQEKMKYEIYQQYQKSKSDTFWDPEYNPKHGYEPYWVDGHWVFQTPTVKEGETTTPMPQVCGDECNYLYQPIREVCGREVTDVYVAGCLYVGFLHRCYNDEMDDHTYGYTTFKSYCEFLDVKCKDAEKDKHWMFVHVGACTKDQDTVIKEIRDSKMLLNRLNNQYLPLIDQTASERNLVPFV